MMRELLLRLFQWIKEFKLELFCLQARVSEVGWGFVLTKLDLVNGLRTKIKEQQFVVKKNQVWKMLIQFSYRYEWTVTCHINIKF